MGESPHIPQLPPVKRAFMRARQSTDIYHRRINRVIDHIKDHLTETLSVERPARMAHFSPFHFHTKKKARRKRDIADSPTLIYDVPFSFPFSFRPFSFPLTGESAREHLGIFRHRPSLDRWLTELPPNKTHVLRDVATFGMPGTMKSSLSRKRDDRRARWALA
jgi:hypothetical protein